MEDVPKLNKMQSSPPVSESSLKIKEEKIKQKKKIISDDTDLTNKILSNLCFENFESQKEKYVPHFYKKEEEIYINNVPLLEQSRFRFLISNNSPIFSNYTKYTNGNFENINWDSIKLIYYYYVEDYKCPICLESKICCPIIIHCGHIFCYPCFLNFYDYSNGKNTIPNCPLCSEKINLEKNEIKFCEMIRCKNYTSNMKIKFHLIMREKASPTLYNIFFDPNLKKWKKIFKYQMKSIPLEITQEFIFNRIFTTNKKLMNSRIENLLKDLNDELKEEKEFYADETRIKNLNQCIDILNNIIQNNEKQNDFIINSVFQKEKLEQNKINNILSEDKLSEEKNNNINNINNNKNGEDLEIDSKKYYFFYQEEEGDIYYLDPLIMDMLLYEYGDYMNLPAFITGNILDVKMKQITPYIKMNYSYLSHLYLGSIIFFVEIDINKIVSFETKKKFSKELNERAKRRRLMTKEENSYEKFITNKSIKEEEEMKKYYEKIKIYHDNHPKDTKKEENPELNQEKKNEKENEINLGNKESENELKEQENKNVKKENKLEKLFKSNEIEKEKERLEQERLEKERIEKENKKKNIFVFNDEDFPQLQKIEKKEKEKENNLNKGGKKGKKKGKKKFEEIEEEFLKDTFSTEEKK